MNYGKEMDQVLYKPEIHAGLEYTVDPRKNADGRLQVQLQERAGVKRCSPCRRMLHWESPISKHIS